MPEVIVGFAMLATQEIYGVTFEVYDHTDNLLASTFQVATYTNITANSDFPEAILSLDFTGTVAYGRFKFDDVPLRYIIDNFDNPLCTKGYLRPPCANSQKNLPFCL